MGLFNKHNKSPLERLAQSKKDKKQEVDMLQRHKQLEEIKNSWQNGTLTYFDKGGLQRQIDQLRKYDWTGQTTQTQSTPRDTGINKLRELYQQYYQPQVWTVEEEPAKVEEKIKPEELGKWGTNIDG